MGAPLRCAPIALLDSGVGGIGVLQEVKKLLPREQLLYFGDTANAPYGERDDSAVLQLVLKASEALLSHCKALVLACNTATAVAAATLRQRHPNAIIVGMEPALVPALRVAAHPRIAVLATAATLRSEKFQKMLLLCQKNADVWPISAPDIVRLVEKGLSDAPEMDAYLRSLFAKLPTPDAVVLGCTHFPFAKAALRRVLGDIPLFDGAAGTAAELARRLQEQELLTPLREGGVCLRASAPASLPLLCSLLQVR